LTLREEYRLWVFENGVMRRIFGPKRDEVTGGWRKLHNKELHNLFSSPSKIKMTKSTMRRVVHVACIGQQRNAYRVLVGKSVGENSYVDNIKMDLMETDLGAHTRFSGLRTDQ
jgi:hypothetical protein